MINRATGEVDFQSGLHIQPHCSIDSVLANLEGTRKTKTQKVSLPGWNQHLLGFHESEHGTFEVEALTAEERRIYLVLLSHQHSFYEPNTPEDAERRTFHEGVISSDLSGQREFTWGEVLCRFESAFNKDWLVVAYHREANVPLHEQEVLLSLRAHEYLPEDDP